MKTPNLFQLATKELSQDAFIVWLLQWADPKYQVQDPTLHTSAQDFVRLLLAETDSFSIYSVNAGRQWKNIDVWAEINNEVLLVIEDKTHTGEHSEQLIKYKAIAEEWCIDEERGKFWKTKLVYLKTGDEAGSFSQDVRAKDYHTVDRRDFLNFLQKHSAITNNIFSDFRIHLEAMEANAMIFNTKPLSSWDDNQWKGFYRWLEEQPEIIEKKWFKVNNATGGFWGYLLNWEQHENEYPIYLQIESHKGDLCFKIATHPDDTDLDKSPDDRGDVRNTYYAHLMNKAEKAGLVHLRRPNRFGNGNYMTIAVVERNHWQGMGDTVINPADVLRNLVMYQNFVRECAQSWSSN